jgi:DNA-binding NtrC family response regulator
VLAVRIPPLDERRDDIPALVAHFAAKQPRRLQFDDGAIAALRAAPWPGNVRQLRNAIDRIAVMCESERVGAADVHEAVSPPSGGAGDPVLRLARTVLGMPGADDKLRIAESALVDEALRMARGNKSAAARLLGVHRKVVERALGVRTAPRPPDD